MAKQRTHMWPLCDRGKPFPDPGSVEKPTAKSDSTAEKKPARHTPKPEVKQRDEEQGRDE